MICSAHQIYDPECNLCKAIPLDPDSYVGVSYSLVKADLAARGFEYRVASIDGECFAMTCEFVPNRYNLHIDDCLVTEVSVG